MAMATAITVYQYPKCSTCRKALAWLAGAGVPHRTVHIVDAPPSKAILKKAMGLAGVPVAKLFNTSGQSYREGGFKDKLATLSDDQALDALARDGKLIKRPLLIGDDVVLIGFREADWARALK
jgi:arsenate reductase (glutaredoxin)